MRKFKEIPNIPDKEDFLSKIIIDEATGCWNWIGRMRGGNPMYQVKGQRDALSARRVSFFMHKGQPSINLVIGLTCGNRSCINPEHMEERSEMSNFSHVETSPQFIKSNSLQCKNGHELNNLNTYSPPKTPHIRKCRTCRDNAQKRRIDTPKKHEERKRQWREDKRRAKIK